MKSTLSLGLASLMVLGIAACGDASNDDVATTTERTTAPDTSAATIGSPSDTAAAGTATTDAGAVREFTFHGVVRKVDSERQMITIDHEKIGDYMEAMTMPFKVADVALLDQVKVGDSTHFTIRVAGEQALITKVQTEHDATTAH